jgi:hypothetical protein
MGQQLGTPCWTGDKLLDDGERMDVRRRSGGNNAVGRRRHSLGHEAGKLYAVIDR